ncbi:MAG: exodeoxyribonuclease VII small subunit [Gammaproteobacteria bacterium]
MVKKKQSEPTNTLSFEESMTALETLVETMEKGELSLDESLNAFEEGIKLTRSCQKSLQEAEQKVEILMKNTADAELEPFDHGE